jgi:hypothetical protein
VDCVVLLPEFTFNARFVRSSVTGSQQWDEMEDNQALTLPGQSLIANRVVPQVHALLYQIFLIKRRELQRISRRLRRSPKSIL